MSTLLGLVVFAAACWIAVRLYERHLDTQMGPWMASKVRVQRNRPRLVRQRDRSNER